MATASHTGLMPAPFGESSLFAARLGISRGRVGGCEGPVDKAARASGDWRFASAWVFFGLCASCVLRALGEEFTLSEVPILWGGSLVRNQVTRISTSASSTRTLTTDKPFPHGDFMNGFGKGLLILLRLVNREISILSAIYLDTHVTSRYAVS